MIRNFTFTLLCFLSLALPASGQDQFSDPFSGLGGAGGETREPVSVEAELIPIDAQTVDVEVTVNIAPGFHIYSEKPRKYSKPTQIGLDVSSKDFETVGVLKASHAPKIVDSFGATVEEYFDSVSWTQRLRSKTGRLPADLVIGGTVQGQYCSATQCLDIKPALIFEAKLPADFDLSSLPSPAASAAKTSQPRSGVVTQRIVPDLGQGSSTAPVSFSVSLSPSDPQVGDPVTLTIKAELAEHWHIYSQSINSDVGKPTDVQLKPVANAVEVDDAFRSSRPFLSKNSPLGDTLEYFDDEVSWSREFTVTDSPAVFEGTVHFQVCTDETCKRPASFQFRVATGSDGGSLSTGGSLASNTTAGGGGQQEVYAASGDVSTSGQEQKSWIPFILAAVGAGFLALLTPCVFPMIPVTVSYFLKQEEENPGAAWKLATQYCLSIIAAFTVLGVMVSIIWSPSDLQAIATNRWMNLFFAFVFTAFGLMLLGVFEFQIPSWLLTWTSKKQDSGGTIGVIFMALTFTLVSFTCTFAFVGNVLALATTGESYLYPIVGMLAFSAAFAAPFFFLSLFPSYLKKLPKSGGWMNRVKVTLGLLELAVVTKFLSVADIGFSSNSLPQYLDHHLVMGIWIVISVVTGLYLLHVFQTSKDSATNGVPGIQALFAIGFLVLGSYITVGMFSAEPPKGTIWKLIYSYAPPELEIQKSDDGLFVSHDGLKFDLDFDSAIKKSKNGDQPVFVDFTGVHCINCRAMEETVLKSPDVHDLLADIVRVQLYTDEIPGLTSGSQDSARILKRNLQLQEDWLGETSLPSYVIATPDGQEILSVHNGYDPGGQEFRKFLNTGLEKWKQRQSSNVAQKSHQPTLTVHK